jgi:hypothetical protein
VLAADRAHEARLGVRQPQVVGPSIGTSAIEWLQRWSEQSTKIPRTPLLRISANVIFTGRSTIADDSSVAVNLQYS